MNPAISVSGLSKCYMLGERVLPIYKRRHQERSSIWALRDITFDSAPGEVLGIIGANGAGKTSLLRIIAGLTQPTEGSVERLSKVGTLLGLGLGVHAELTGRENIFLAGGLHGMRRADIRKQFDAIVEFAELQKFIDTPVKFYSSGMRARLSFAIAMHLEHPDIMLIDEVLAAGDIRYKQKALESIAAFAKSGKTILISSHGVTRLQEMCDRCLYLHEGRIKAIGSPEEVIATYREDALASKETCATV